MVPTRRDLLQAGCLFGSIALAGCKEFLPGVCGSMNRIEIKATPASLSTSEVERENPIKFENLSKPEQNIMRTAIENNGYTDCIGSEADGVDQLRNRLDTYDNTDEDIQVYLKYEGYYYSLYFKNGDAIYAAPK